jgi:hypothetical protein
MLSEFAKRLVQICIEERNRFGNGQGKEWQDPHYLRVGVYWDRLSKVDGFQSWAGYNGRSDIVFDAGGVPKKDKNNNSPWSAAFISYVMWAAGAESNFAYSSAHSTYIVRALREAAKQNSKAAFIARRHKLYAPKVGDLIACERQPTIDPNFDTYIDYVKVDKYHAHCDIVVGIEDKVLTTIGGNVSHSVREKKWPINAQGMIGNSDPLTKSSAVICIIETRL